GCVSGVMRNKSMKFPTTAHSLITHFAHSLIRSFTHSFPTTLLLFNLFNSSILQFFNLSAWLTPVYTIQMRYAARQILQSFSRISSQALPRSWLLSCCFERRFRCQRRHP